MLPDTQALQQEIRRLNALVRLLTDRNLELEAQLDRQQRAGEATEDLPPLNPGGYTQPLVTPSSYSGGNPYTRVTPLVNPDGRETQRGTPSENTERSASLPGTPVANAGGNTTEVVTPPCSALRLEEAPLAPAPVFALPLPDEATLVRRLKKAGLGNVHNEGVRRAAHLLLWAAREHGPITYAAIGARLGLSQSGACKLVSSLRRRGLLARTAWQRLRLTDAARALLFSPHQ